MGDVPLIRIYAGFPPAPSWRRRVRQVLWALIHVDQNDLKPVILAVNPAGYVRVLFVAETVAEANEKLERVGNELEELGVEAWCERYRVPLSFVEALEPPELPTGLARFQPLL